MRLRPFSILSVVALAALASGCARTGSFTRMPSLDKPQPAAAADKSDEAASAEKPTEPNPEAAKSPATTTADAPNEDAKAKEDAAKTAASDTPETPPAEETTPPVETASAETPSSDEASPPPDGLDAETLMLMNEHLKNVPFEEREQLYQEWKSLDAETIRERIRLRESDTSTSEIPEEFLQGAADSNTPAEAGLSSPEDSMLASTGVVPVAFEANAEEIERERPVPLMDGLISEGGEAPPEQRPSPGLANWDEQLQKLVPIAEARAETTHALYLASKSKPSGENDEAADALRRDYIASQVDLRLLYLMAGERGRALQIIPDLEPADQEFWRQVLWSMASYFDVESLPDRSERVAQTIEQLREAINKLQGAAKLQLQNVAFCRKITSFGNFERFEEDAYSAGQKVLLYAEIVNFKSIQNETDGLYKTQLKSTIEILREGETQPLQRIEFDPTVDLCRSHRHDYFHSYELKLPEELPSGAYVLKLSVEDTQSEDLAVYTLNFTIE